MKDNTIVRLQLGHENYEIQFHMWAIFPWRDWDYSRLSKKHGCWINENVKQTLYMSINFIPNVATWYDCNRSRKQGKSDKKQACVPFLALIILGGKNKVFILVIKMGG